MLENAQFDGKQSKTCFWCYKAENTVFQQGASNIKLKAAQFSCQQTKTCFWWDQTESSVIYKGSLVTKKEENVVLRKMMLKTAQPSQKLAKPL